MRAARERAGLTQQALADAVGCSLGAIGGLERGDVWPEYERLTAVARALSVPERSLFAWGSPFPTPQEALRVLEGVVARDSVPPRAIPAPETLSPLKQELLRLLTAPDDPDPQALRALLERLQDPALDRDLAVAGIEARNPLLKSDRKPKQK